MAMKRSIKITLAVTLGLAALVLNPWFGVTSGYDYGAPEMRAAIEGTWRLTPNDGARREITFRIAQGAEPKEPHASSHALVRSAAACGRRSLVKNAEACRDFSEMPLEITVLDGGTPERDAIPARFAVTGTTFTHGWLEAQIADVIVSGSVTPNGETASVTALETAGKRRKLPSTLQRIGR